MVYADAWMLVCRVCELRHVSDVTCTQGSKDALRGYFLPSILSSATTLYNPTSCLEELPEILLSLFPIDIAIGILTWVIRPLGKALLSIKLSLQPCFFYWELSIRFTGPFVDWILHFLMLTLCNSLFIFNINSCLAHSSPGCFSHPIGNLFMLKSASFALQRHLGLLWSCLVILGISPCVTGKLFRSSCLHLYLEVFYL